MSAAPAFSSVNPAVRFRIGPVVASHHQPVHRALRARYLRRHAGFSITAGGRFNVANINLQDQIGTALNGSDTYTRFNPIIGGTYKITPGLTAYAGYSEANRAPTPLELGCADPAHPCIIASFLVSDPPLKQVVSHTVEAGLRGTQELQFGTLGWKLGGFRADNTDDILAIPSPVVQGFGYFQNVGSTRRQGIEAEVTLKSKKMQFYASYTFIDARFLNALHARLRTARLPTPTAISRLCRATKSRRFRATGSRPVSTMWSPTPSRSAATRCSSAASISSATNPTSS